MDTTRLPRVARDLGTALLIALAIFGPAVGIAAATETTLQRPPSALTPWWDDEVENYLSTAAFARAGFSGGYFTAAEHAAPASFTHFSTHGPTFPILQGSWAKLFGWRPASGLFFNVAVLALATLVFIAVVPLNAVQVGLLAVTLIGFFPFYEYAPSNMQEPLHLAIALLFGAAFYLLFYQPQRVTRGLRWGLFAGILLAALIRSSWALLFVPYFLLLARRRPLDLLLALLQAGAATVSSLLIWKYLCAPMPMVKNAYLMIKAVSGETDATTIFDNVRRNVGELMTPTQSFNWLVLPCIAQTFALLAALALLALVNFKRREGRTEEYAFHIYNLGAITVSTIFFYFVAAAGSRVFALHLLLTLVLFIASNRPRFLVLAGLVAASNLLVLKPALAQFEKTHFTHFAADSRARGEAFYAEVKDVLFYRESPNGWCNTVLTGRSTFRTPHHMSFIGLPPGLGLSHFQSVDEMGPVKSKWVITDPESAERLGVSSGLVRRLSSFPNASLYQNPNSACDR